MPGEDGIANRSVSKEPNTAVLVIIFESSADTVAMKTATAEHPVLPFKLTEAFREAKRLSSEYISTEESRGYEKEKAVLGEDPYAYVLGKRDRKS